jgi:hypothetical protein
VEQLVELQADFQTFLGENQGIKHNILAYVENTHKRKEDKTGLAAIL